jgi:hypothetical protein
MKIGIDIIKTRDYSAAVTMPVAEGSLLSLLDVRFNLSRY